MLISYDLLFNLGWNISRETKNYFILIKSIQKKFVYLSFGNFGLFLLV